MIGEGQRPSSPPCCAMGFKQGNGGQLSYIDDAMVAAKAAPTKRRWLMSPNARRGAEAAFSLVARSVQAGQRPVFCKKDFSPKPPSSMTRWSRLKPLLQKDGFCWRGFRPEPSSSMTQRVAAEAAPTASIFLAVAPLVPAGQPGLSSFLRVGYYWAEANEEVERWSALLGRCPFRRGREADEMREVEPWSRLG
jgi:hypothetical protein